MEKGLIKRDEATGPIFVAYDINGPTKAVVNGSQASDNQLLDIVNGWIKAATELDDPSPADTTVSVQPPSKSKASSICNFVVRLISFGLGA